MKFFNSVVLMFYFDHAFLFSDIVSSYSTKLLNLIDSKSSIFPIEILHLWRNNLTIAVDRYGLFPRALPENIKNVDAFTVENLNNYLIPLGNQNCFVVLNNFENVDLPKFSHPVMISSSELFVHINNTHYGNQVSEFFWLPPSLHYKVASGTDSCQMSKFLVHNTFYAVCLKINLNHYAPFIKPWNCEAYFDLFPNLPYFYSVWGPPYSSKRFYKFTSINTVFPSSMPVTNIIVGVESIQTHLRSFQSMMYAAMLENSMHTYETFFYAVAQRVDSNKLIFLPSGYIQELKLVTMSHKGYLSDTEILVKVSDFALSSEALNSLTRWTSASPSNEILAWKLDNDYLGSRQQMLCQSLLLCTNPLEITGTPQDRLIQLNANVWFSIFQNYSIRISDDLSCINGKLLRTIKDKSTEREFFYLIWTYMELFLTAFSIYAVKYQDDINNLRFISCGKTTKESLLFGELINIYDYWVWGFIVASAFGISITFTKAGDRATFFIQNLDTLQILVGQGGFRNRIMKRTCLTFAAAAFLFMSMIISEGYKNSNLYNIISPRKSIPKESFQEIVKDNFTVYTTSNTLEFRMPEYENAEIFVDEVMNVDHSIASEAVYVASEVLKLEEKYKYQIKYKRLLEAHSKLIPPLAAKMNETVVSNSNWFQDNYSEEDPDLNITSRLRNLEESVKAWEKNTIFSFLKDCDRVALILPYHMCTNYAKKLSFSDEKHVSVGKEIYQTASSGVTLVGLIPLYIVRRIQGIEMAGIWDWHSYVVQIGPEFKSGSEPDRPTKATMKGNVLVVFLLLPVGFVTACVRILFEVIISKCTGFSSGHFI